MKKSHSCCLRADGFIYVELLTGLCLAAMIFSPAYRFAAQVVVRANTEARPSARGPAEDRVLDRNIRCAIDDPRYVPFNYHDGVLHFATSVGDGTIAVCREKIAARCFDGEKWLDEWGWDRDNARPSRGVRGLPLAVELATGDDSSSRRVVPVMTAVMNRWAR